ncbi:hypothetical protein [Jatrophihabitans endophyticus]|nr:hypothetical protein [Jatrophihabitans endophyticus]MBE7187237.1 hypothetical protein [Jatrophihabitans endophyticus]
MTGFDPTAPDRDTDVDEPDRVPGNVVPPESLEDDEVAAAEQHDDEGD